jgi:acetylornithine deacetylase/succinyl-diaminopimelate desuccinylase-like protein
MKQEVKFIEENFSRFVEELKELLRIPSVSTDSYYNKDIQNCAKWLKDHLEKIGLSKTEIIQTGKHPVVYSEYVSNSSAPTILIYSHYDVQPPDPLELWKSEPFEPVIKNNLIIARGAVDDKGQMFIILKAIETLLKTKGNLPCNLKLVLEGEEESGSVSLFEFIKNNKEKLKADIALACDTAMVSENTPAITISLRGILYVELLVRTSNRDLHSGVYGGAITNPLNVISDLMSKIKDDRGKVIIPGFYDDVVELDKREKADISQIPFDEKDWLSLIGSSRTKTENGCSIIEATTRRPSFDVHGIRGGYTGEGLKTVIPLESVVKFSFRLVPNQKPEKILKSLKAFINEHIPNTVKYELRVLSTANPVLIDKDNTFVTKAIDALEETFNTKAFLISTGGSLPVVNSIKEDLKIDTILIRFGLEEDGAHAPNESFSLNRFKKGIESLTHFLNSQSMS